jgi:maleate cis-trans isomerase
MALVRSLDTRRAQAVFLSGVGMPTLDVLQPLEDELGLPVLSSASAMMWNALRIAGVSTPVTGFGRLLSQDR